jgi:hypothetical protein
MCIADKNRQRFSDLRKRIAENTFEPQGLNSIALAGGRCPGLGGYRYRLARLRRAEQVLGDARTCSIAPRAKGRRI